MPPGWEATRLRVLARDGGLCVWDAEPAVEVHHLLPGEESEELLVSLCHACHQAITTAHAALVRQGGPQRPPWPPPGRQGAQSRGRARAAGGGPPPRPRVGGDPSGGEAAGAFLAAAQRAAGFGLFGPVTFGDAASPAAPGRRAGR